MREIRRPTDNAITERFYGTIKQEYISPVGTIGASDRHGRRSAGMSITTTPIIPRQSLMNFTPAYVQQMNNKDYLLDE